MQFSRSLVRRSSSEARASVFRDVEKRADLGLSRKRGLLENRCRTAEAVEYGDTNLVGKKSPNDFL